MNPLPKSEQRQIVTPFGIVIGVAYQWSGGQYCAVHTSHGVLGCGIYDIACANEFNMAFAIAKGTPAHPLREPEDLFEARVVAVSNAAKGLGVVAGMTGSEVIQKYLASDSNGNSN